MSAPRHLPPRALRRAAFALSALIALSACADGAPALLEPAPGGGQQPPPPPRVVTQVDIDAPSDEPLLVRGSRQLRARLRAVDGTLVEDQRPAWTSSDTAVAGVTPEGVVFARAVGETVVVATAGAGRAERRIVVAPAAVARIELSVARVTLAAGETHAFGAVALGADGRVLADRAVVFRSAHDDILAVNADGRVRGLRPGRTLVVAETEGRRATAEVTVTEGVVGEGDSRWTMAIGEVRGGGVRCAVGPVTFSLRQVGNRVEGRVAAGARVECSPVPGAGAPFVTPSAPHDAIEGTIDPDGRTVRLHAAPSRWTFVGTVSADGRTLEGEASHVGDPSVTAWGPGIARLYQGRFVARR